MYSVRPSLRVPPATLMFSWRSRSMTFWTERPVRRSCSSSRETWISSSRPPRTRTAATPLIGSRARLTCSSAMRRSRRSSASSVSEPRPPGQAQLQHRVEGGVEAQDQRPLGLVGQEDQVELLQGVLDGVGHLGAPGELEDDVADPGAAHAGDPPQAADHPQGLLDGPGDVVLDLLGGGPGILGAHREGGVAQLRHQVDREPPVGEEAEDDRGQEDHRDGHRSRGEEAAVFRHRTTHWLSLRHDGTGEDEGRGLSRPWHRPRRLRRRSPRGRRGGGPGRRP